MTATILGPFETERQARMAALAATDPNEASLLTSAGNREILARACEDAGVTLGAYDERILAWLAGFEPAMCAVVAGLVTRAHAAGAAPVG